MLSLKYIILYTIVREALTLAIQSENVMFRGGNVEPEIVPPRIFFFIFSGLAFGTLLRILTQTWKVPLPFRVLLLLCGLLLGLLAKVSTVVEAYTTLVHIEPRYLLMAFLPVLMFKMAFCVDTHTFTRSWGQILLISIPGLIISTAFTGLVMRPILNSEWSYPVGILFGLLCSTSYAAEVITMLQEVGSYRYLSILLQGEAMIGNGAAIIMFEIILGIINAPIHSWYNVLSVFLRFAGGAIIVGLVFGKILGCVIGCMYNDPVNILILTISTTYLVYYVCTEVLFVSGVIAVVIIGILASIEKTTLSAEVETFVVQFWSMLGFATNTMIFLIFGVICSENLLQTFTSVDLAFVTVTYVIANVGRLLSFILLAPILSRIGYGLSFKNLTVLVWGGLRGAVSLGLTLIVYNENPADDTGRQFLMHVAALVTMTLIINATTMPLLLRLLGLLEQSTAKKANMNSCMKYLETRRLRNIAMLKMDRFLADANWPMVNTATILKHPYQMKLSDSDDEDDYYLRYRMTTCPDCQKEVPNEPTNKEMAEMQREARIRILKAKRISYSRQYENGLLSKDGIRVLCQAVEIAMDTKYALIELDGLHNLFKKQGVIHYARRKLLMFFFKQTENPAKPPRKYWRRVCYHLIMHTAFEIFFYCCIIINFIEIGVEMTHTPETLSTLDITLKVLNTTFCSIFMAEFLLKIFGYSWIYIWKDGVKTYFRSYWNIFDFTLLIVTIGDLVLDYMDVFLPDFKKSSLQVSQFILGMKMVRIVQLLRLFRLCKAWYPSLIRYCDSSIDKKLAFAYDVGKGYVTGEEEVSVMLIQMIDNDVIREDARLQIEADRLAITKELATIQKERPWIAITVKTRQAIRATLNSLQESLLELKVSGL